MDFGLGGGGFDMEKRKEKEKREGGEGAENHKGIYMSYIKYDLL